MPVGLVGTSTRRFEPMNANGEPHMKPQVKLQRTINASLVLVLIAASGMAIAAPEKIKRNKEILKGPSVTSTTQSPRTNDSMDSMEPMDSDQQMQNRVTKQDKRPVRLREYMMILRQQRGQQTANKLGLSEDQQSQIKAIIEEHRQAMKAFQEEHREQIAALKNKIREARKNQQADRSKNKNINTADEKPQGNPRADQAREKIRNFLDSAPANKAAFSKIKSVLTSEQQEMVKARARQLRASRTQDGQRPGQARRDKRQGDRQQTNRPVRVRPNKSNINRKDVDAENAKRKGKGRPTPEDD